MRKADKAKVERALEYVLGVFPNVIQIARQQSPNLRDFREEIAALREALELVRE